MLLPFCPVPVHNAALSDPAAIKDALFTVVGIVSFVGVAFPLTANDGCAAIRS